MSTHVATEREGEPLEARSAKRAIRAALVAAFLSTLSMLGWSLESPLLTSLLPGATTFKANTALAILAASISMVLQAKALSHDAPLFTYVARTLALVPLLLGGAVLVQYGAGIDLGIDQLVVSDGSDIRFPGRPSPSSAISLVLVAVVLLLGSHTKYVVTLQASAVLMIVLVWAALAAYVYELTLKVLAPGYHTVSLPAAVCYFSLAYAALWLRPGSGLIRMLSSDTLAGSSARALVPVAALLPVGLGWLYLVGTRSGWMRTEIGIVSFIMGTIAGYLMVGGFGIARMYRLEMVRDAVNAARQRLTDGLQLTTRAAHIGIWDWQIASNELVWDRGMHELYGVPEGQFGGTYEDWKRYVFPEDLARLDEAVQSAIRGRADLFIEFRIRRPDGEERVLQGRSIVMCDDSGEPYRLLGADIDVTDAERARLALQESEERFRAAMEYAAIGVALVSLEGRFVKVNRALSEIVGYSEEELLERTFQEITHPDDLDADLAQARDLLEGRISHYHMEKRYFHKSGRIVWILLSGSLVRSAAGEPRVFVAEIQDITDRKQHEAQLVSSVREKEVLLREIHHRVKNNLQVISSMLRLQAARVGAPDVEEMFEDAQARVQAMALIHDRLYQSPSLVGIDFAAYLRELSSMLLVVFGRPGRPIRLVHELDDVFLDLDTAIPLALVANELITNALKHAFPGRENGAIFLSLTRDGTDLVLTVADDGIGLPEEFSFDSKKSLGMRLVTSFAHQLRGTLGVHRGKRNAISLSIPRDPALEGDG
jgi:PAS domain S-box-containing protein